MEARVLAVHRSGTHTFRKPTCDSITLIEGFVVEGDAHADKTVKHLWDAKKNPEAPNLRQVHLINRELHEQLQSQGFEIEPGWMGENIATAGMDLLSFPCGAKLQLGREAGSEVTGLRNPYAQLNTIKDGLLNDVIRTDTEGDQTSFVDVMSIVKRGGAVKPNDLINFHLPKGAHKVLKLVWETLTSS